MGSAGVCDSTFSCIFLESVSPSPSSSSYFSLIRFAGGFPCSGIAASWKPRGGISKVLGRDPTLAALVPWQCCSALPALPRSTAGFPGTQLSPFAESKQPLESGLCVCPPCLACGLSTSADTLSRDLGAQIGGQCPHLVPAHGAYHVFPGWLGIFQGRVCCLFPPARLIHPGIPPEMLVLLPWC